MKDGPVERPAIKVNRREWYYEDDDSYRSTPFQRWIKLKRSGAFTEIVLVPSPNMLGIKDQRHIAFTWQGFFPEIHAWWLNNNEQRPYRWGDILFVKHDNRTERWWSE